MRESAAIGLASANFALGYLQALAGAQQVNALIIVLASESH